MVCAVGKGLFGAQDRQDLSHAIKGQWAETETIGKGRLRAWR